MVLNKKRLGVVAISTLIISLFVFIIHQVVANETSQEPVEFETKKLANLNQAKSNIKAIGQVQPLSKVKLSSEISGKVKKLNARLGAKVKANNLLVELDHTQQDQQVLQAKSKVEQARANLAQKIAGATKYEIQQASAKVSQARKSLQQARSNLEKTKVVAQNKIETAKINLTQASSTADNTNLFNITDLEQATESAVKQANKEAATALDAFSITTDIQYEYYNDNSQQDIRLAEKKRDALRKFTGSEGGKTIYRFIVDNYGGVRGKIKDLNKQQNYNPQEVIQTLNDFSLALQSIKEMLNESLVALNSASDPDTTFKQDLNTTIGNINQSLVNITNSRQKIKQAQIKLKNQNESNNLSYQEAYQNYISTKKEAQKDIESASSSVAVKKAALQETISSYRDIVSPSRSVDLASLRAKLQEAKINYDSAVDSRKDAFIRSPIYGEVSSVAVEVGENVSSNETLLTVVNTTQKEVELYLSPEQVNLVDLNDQFKLEQGGQAQVKQISPVADSSNGKVKLVLTIDKDNNYIPGEYLRVQIPVTENSKEKNQYLVPFSAVDIRPDTNYIYYLTKQGKIRQKEITTNRVIGEKILIEGVGDINSILLDANKAKQHQKTVNDGKEKVVQRQAKLSFYRIGSFPRMSLHN